VPVFDPSMPPLRVPVFGDKVIAVALLVENAMVLPLDPQVMAVTVTMLVERVAVTLAFATVPVPKQGETGEHCPAFALIAARRLAALLEVLPETMSTSLGFTRVVTNL